MKPAKKSPATSGKVHRADITNDTPSAARGKHYHGIADLVEQNPDAHAVDVYAGRDCIGTIFQVGREHHAFDLGEAALGAFPDRPAAMRAVRISLESSRAIAS